MIYGRSTPIVSKVATAAAAGDWEPAKALCRKHRDRHGECHARDLMRSIQDAVSEARR